MRSQRLRAAIERRGARATQNREVCRLVAGRADQLDGFVLDRLGDYAFGTVNQDEPPVTQADLEALMEALGLKGLTLRSRQKGGQGAVALELGGALPERIGLEVFSGGAASTAEPELASFLIYGRSGWRWSAPSARVRAQPVRLSGLFGIRGASRVARGRVGAPSPRDDPRQQEAVVDPSPLPTRFRLPARSAAQERA